MKEQIINYHDPYIQKQLAKIKDDDNNKRLYYKEGSDEWLYMVCLVNGLFDNFRNVNKIHSKLIPYTSSQINPFHVSPTEYKEIIKTNTVFIIENRSDIKLTHDMMDKINKHIRHYYGNYNRWICKFLNENYFLIIDTVK